MKACKVGRILVQHNGDFFPLYYTKISRKSLKKRHTLFQKLKCNVKHYEILNKHKNIDYISFIWNPWTRNILDVGFGDVCVWYIKWIVLGRGLRYKHKIHVTVFHIFSAPAFWLLSLVQGLGRLFHHNIISVLKRFWMLSISDFKW